MYYCYCICTACELARVVATIYIRNVCLYIVWRRYVFYVVHTVCVVLCVYRACDLSGMQQNICISFSIHCSATFVTINHPVPIRTKVTDHLIRLSTALFTKGAIKHWTFLGLATIVRIVLCFQSQEQKKIIFLFSYLKKIQSQDFRIDHPVSFYDFFFSLFKRLTWWVSCLVALSRLPCLGPALHLYHRHCSSPNAFMLPHCTLQFCKKLG